MIASLGGAEVSKDGSRNYAGSGGMVGGISLPFAGSSNFTGAGKAYYRFTPDQTGNRNAIDIYGTGGGNYPEPVPTYPTGGGGNGGGTIIIGGSPTAPTFPSPTGAPTYTPPSQPYRGLSQITSGGNQVINTLNGIFSFLQSGGYNQQQALTQAQLLAAYLNNPQVFYQAQHGNDASALQSFRQQAAAIISAITNWIGTSTTPTTFPTGQQSPPFNPCVNGDCPTQIPMQPNPTLLDMIASLTSGASPRTSVEAPPNLYQVAPDSGGSGSNMKNLIVLAVLGFGAYWLYKKYA